MRRRWKQLMGILISVVFTAGNFSVPVSAKEKTELEDLLKVKSNL